MINYTTFHKTSEIKAFMLVFKAYLYH